MNNAPPRAGPTALALLLPLALAQFIASYAASNMTVAVSNIANDLHTDVHGVQVTITFFTLTMAALMIPGSKLTDIWGRQACFRLGLVTYGAGALIALLAPGLGVLMVGYSALEGIGSALMIPPIYILVTVITTDLPSRARAFGAVSGAAGIGAAAGPLIGGLVTTTISWRASFLLQVLVVAVIFALGLRVSYPRRAGARPQFDLLGAILSAAGLFFIVLGILQSGTYGWFQARKDFAIGSVVLIEQGGVSPVWPIIAIGALILLWFFLHIRRREQAHKEPLLSTRLFKSRTSNLGLFTQNIQWLVLQGSFFVISVFLQTQRSYSAIETGLILTPATAGVLLSSAIAGGLARRCSQRTLVRGGFVLTTTGMVLLLLLGSVFTSGVLALVPGLLLMGLGVGVMLTASVNVVQSSFPDSEQGEISGLSRSVSNLGSSLGTAIVGSVLVAASAPAAGPFGRALIALVVIAVLGLGAAMLLPPGPIATQPSTEAPPRGRDGRKVEQWS
ncbi:MAG TPA: MFS transporter [Candidatus Dormibacteraeota bacterium]|nr:MFS transporter [Candidatus Dormibacteraeota bacterium]